MSSNNPTAKEAVYDRTIYPLMAQVIAICKANKINMIASFSLGIEIDQDSDYHNAPLLCTTALDLDKDDDSEVRSRFSRAVGLIRKSAEFAAITITTHKAVDD